METTLFKPLSESQKAEIIDAIVNSDEDVELVLNYLSRCTPYQVAEWYEHWDTKTYIKLYLDYIIDGFLEQSEFARLFELACLTFWSNDEKLDAIQKGTVEAEDFLPKDFGDFHKPYSEALGSSD